MAGGLHLEGNNRASDNDSSSGSNSSSVDALDTKSSQPQSPADTVQRPPFDLPKAEGRGQPGFRQVSAAPRQTSGDPAVESSLKPSSEPKPLQPFSSSFKSSAKVRFEAQPITAIWLAHSSQEYDRRSIVVDLSKSPFALFRKDAVMMKAASAAAASPTPVPRPSPPALDVTYQTSIPEVPSRSPSPRSARGMSTESLRSDDSDASDSSTGHTDNETDLDPSDSDWSPCSKRVPGLRKGIPEAKPAFFGVWKRTSSEGYEKFLLSSGVPKKATAMALRRHTVHIIDHDGTYVRLIVKNGLSKVDNTFFIGDEPRVVSQLEFCYEKSLPTYSTVQVPDWQILLGMVGARSVIKILEYSCL